MQTGIDVCPGHFLETPERGKLSSHAIASHSQTWDYRCLVCWACAFGNIAATMATFVALQGKKARMQKQAASNLDDISSLATKTMRDSKRKLPKILSWSRTN